MSEPEAPAPGDEMPTDDFERILAADAGRPESVVEELLEERRAEARREDESPGRHLHR